MDPVADPIKTSMLPCGVVTGTKNTMKFAVKIDGSVGVLVHIFFGWVQHGTTIFHIC